MVLVAEVVGFGEELGVMMVGIRRRESLTELRDLVSSGLLRGDVAGEVAVVLVTLLEGEDCLEKVLSWIEDVLDGG